MPIVFNGALPRALLMGGHFSPLRALSLRNGISIAGQQQPPTKHAVFCQNIDGQHIRVHSCAFVVDNQ
jgi:hypothetical protein